VTGVQFVRNEVNLGFIGACNHGAALARGEVLLFLNNDTIVTPGWLDAILACSASIRMRGSSARSSSTRTAGCRRRAASSGGTDRHGTGAANDDPDKPEYNYLREADYCSGACLAVPSALFREVGGFDASYTPAYYEDVDLAFSVRAAGRSVYYQPFATVVHFEGQTSGTDESAGVKRHQVVNQATFANKWGNTLALHRANGIHPELEHDRGAQMRVLVIDACMLTPITTRDRCG
jgi:GT2 family glycosyltransferase